MLITARNAMYGSKRSAAIQTASFVIDGQKSLQMRKKVCVADIKQALLWMQEGKIVRLPQWNKLTLHLNGNYLCAQDGELCYLSFDTLNSNEWEIVD